MKLKVACIQLRTGTDVHQNIEHTAVFIREAHKQGAQFIATPENTSLLDKRPGELLKKTKSEDEDEALHTFLQLAQELEVWLLIGSLPIRISEEKCANRSFLISPEGKIVARYDKIHMFDIQLSESEIYRESDRYTPGDKAIIAKTPFAKIGMTICYDVRFPQLYKDLAKAGAQILTIPSAFVKKTGEAHWNTLSKARAIETGSFVLAPAQGGIHEDGRETYGHSMIVSPHLPTFDSFVRLDDADSAVCALDHIHAIFTASQSASRAL